MYDNFACKHKLSIIIPVAEPLNTINDETRRYNNCCI